MKLLVIKTEYFVQLPLPKFKELVSYVDEQGKQEIKNKLMNYDITVDISKSYIVQEYNFYVAQLEKLWTKVLHNRIDNETALEIGKELEAKRDAAKIKVNELEEKTIGLRRKAINRKIKFLEG